MCRNSPTSTIRLFKNNNYLTSTSLNAITLNVSTNVWPLFSSAGSTAWINMHFNAPTTITVDFGDGIANRKSYEAVSVGSEYYWNIYNSGANVANPPASISPIHTYTDGQTNHTVTIYYNAAALTYFSLAFTCYPLQDLGFVFSKHTSLKQFQLTNCVIPPDNTKYSFINLDLNNIQLMQQLQILILQQCFNQDVPSPYYGVLPLGLLNQPLTYLGFGDSGFSGKTFAASNMDKIATSACKDTLNAVNVVYALFDNNSGDGAFPHNWTTLPNLTNLVFTGVAYTVVPPDINLMTKLTALQIGIANSLANWGDLSALVNLTNLGFTLDSSLPATAPPWITNLTSLKSWDMRSVYQTNRPAGTIDTFITNIYNVITGMAIPLRGVTFYLGSYYATTQLSQTPSGTYQQPSGYVQGGANGSPASSLERLWVLDHQYTWKCSWQS